MEKNEFIYKIKIKSVSNNIKVLFKLKYIINRLEYKNKLFQINFIFKITDLLNILGKVFRRI